MISDNTPAGASVRETEDKAGRRASRQGAIKARSRDFARDHWPLLIVFAIMAVAFAVRLYYLGKHTEYTADSYYFLILARSIRDTFTYTVRGITHTKYLPGYPIAIWLGSYIFGGFARSANLIAVLGGTFTVLATYGIGREIFNKWVGLVAALLVAFQPTFLKWTVLPMTEGLFTFLFAGGVYMLITGCKKASPARRTLGAISGGLCFLVRWEGILFLPLMVLIVLLYYKGSKLRAWEPFVMLSVFAGPMAIYVTRNLIVTGKISSYVGEYREYSTDISYQVFKHRFKVYAWNGFSDALFAVFFYLGMAWCLLRRKWKEFLVLGGWFALFVAMHMIWYYAYERFMAPAMPVVGIAIGFLLVDLAMLTATRFKGAEWLFSRSEAGKPHARADVTGPDAGTPRDHAPGAGSETAGPDSSTGPEGPRRTSRERKGLSRPLVQVAQVTVYCVLAIVLAALVWHGTARAANVITQDYRAFADDHGGRGMEQAADWLNTHAPGQLVAADAGPYFDWLYYPGDVLYMRPVPWDLPVEEADITYVDAPGQLYLRGVRYLVIGQTEKGVDDELAIFGIVGPVRKQVRQVATWVNRYDFPTPHDLTTTIFEVLPPG